MRRLWRALIGLGDVLVLGAFALGLAARHVRPGALTWPLQLLGPLVPALAALVVAVALVRVWRAGAGTRLAYGLAAAAVVVRFGLPFGGGADVRAGDLTVVTYNVPRWAGPDTSRKADEIDAYVRRVRPAILAFQEPTLYYRASAPERVVVAPFLRRLRDSLGYRVGRPAFSPTSRSRLPVFTRGLRIVQADESRMRADSSGAFTDIARVAFALAAAPRPAGDAAAVPESLPDTSAARTAVLYNVHLYTHGARKPWDDPGFSLRHPRSWAVYLARFRDAHLRRAWEADSLRALLDAETRPVLVVGDFNATAHEWPFARIRSARGGLTDALGKAGRGWNATYHRDLPLLRIDHVLVSREWQIVAARVPRDVAASDHLPVEVRLRMR